MEKVPVQKVIGQVAGRAGLAAVITRLSAIGRLVRAQTLLDGVDHFGAARQGNVGSQRERAVLGQGLHPGQGRQQPVTNNGVPNEGPVPLALQPPKDQGTVG